VSYSTGRVLDGFRSIESGLIEIERRRRGTETVTLSLSSAFNHAHG